MNIESLRQEFNEWHFLDWKLNCAVTETVEEARNLYERIYKPFHLDQISEREQCFKAWMAGRVFEAKKLEGCVVVPEAEFALLPKTITPEIEEILGMPCFKFIKAAQIYRQLGFNIPPKAEKEQSFFMFKFLHLALVHGDKCFDVFETETKAMVEAARGGK